MNTFIQLHRLTVSSNIGDSFTPILINIRDIIAIEPTAQEGCGSEIYVRGIRQKKHFHPLYCREQYDEVLALLKELGLEPISL